MGEMLGLEVRTLDFGLNGIPDTDEVRRAAREFRPSVVTAVHCETPSGTVTPLRELGEISAEVGALFMVDFVASGCGMPVDADANHIDLGLLGSQKALSLPSSLSVATVSQAAWQRIESVGYVGYDAFAPWRKAAENRLFPYTHDWQMVAALDLVLDKLEHEGLEQVYLRHERAARLCRERAARMGLELFPEDETFAAPTVTAIYVPSQWTWPSLDAALRSHGVALGGNYGPLAGKVFRVGHMGTQADDRLVAAAMDVLERVLTSR
jgi:aspartate aminotransferase-like enzyme